MFTTFCGGLGAITFVEFLKSAVFLLGYISSNNLFPEPLSAEDERMYLEQMKKGSEEARNILIERNLRLVAHICKKYTTAKAEQDDLISIGTIGLMKAVNSYRPEKGVKLGTYAARCIENEILMHFRANRKSSNEISLSETLDHDSDGNSMELMDMISCEDKNLQAVDNNDQYKQLYEHITKNLQPREQQIIQLRYGLGGNEPLTQREIASMYGISRSYISRIEKKALQKLADAFNAQR